MHVRWGTVAAGRGRLPLTGKDTWPWPRPFRPCPLATLALWPFVNQLGLIPHLQHFHWLFSAWKAPPAPCPPLVQGSPSPLPPKMSPQPGFSALPSCSGPSAASFFTAVSLWAPSRREGLALTTEGLLAHGGPGHLQSEQRGWGLGRGAGDGMADLPFPPIHPVPGLQVILGNEDPGGVVLKDLGPPMVARLVRFYPRADRVMSVCLRVELYGCLWKGELFRGSSPPPPQLVPYPGVGWGPGGGASRASPLGSRILSEEGTGQHGLLHACPHAPSHPPDGLLSYTAPVGQTMNLAEAVHLNDSTYDGHTTHTVGG